MNQPIFKLLFTRYYYVVVHAEDGVIEFINKSTLQKVYEYNLGSSIKHCVLTPNHKELLIIDEEQHFGVAHKERLKSLKTNVHVLVLTATPIPRTLQMALTGLREMSLIATPPVDRLAVRTFVLPFDPVILREAMVRELHRGGQIYYVCPRVSDLDGVANQVTDLVPDARVVVAHGQVDRPLGRRVHIADGVDLPRAAHAEVPVVEGHQIVALDPRLPHHKPRHQYQASRGRPDDRH